MLRWIMPLLAVTLTVGSGSAIGSAWAAEIKPGVRPAADQLPAGLPRKHYRYRTTVTPATPPYGRRVYVEEEPEVLFTPSSGVVPYVSPRLPLIFPGSLGLPGYYGSASSSDYQGPYYGGPYVGTWSRLPYACGIYGYC